ncbi:MAG TPA: glycoside hydrolase family 28 protein [Rhodothermales bacterium]|nr:glycoside hydrolase family 28 protein [Rhodothermales bacterium]
MLNHRTSRREALKGLALGAGALALAPGALLGCRTMASAGAGAVQGWDLVPGILARIRPPRFRDRDFDITRYGAVAGGTVDCTDAFRRAIAACHGAGGGRVVVPAGTFLTGPIHLRSRVNLHVSEGATIQFSNDPARYLPAVFTRWEGVELMNYSPLIYAFEQEDVAVTGTGVLDGGGDETHWWPWKGRAEYGWKQGDPMQTPARNRLFDMAERGVPPEQRVFGEGDYLRPQFIQPYRCRNVLIEGVTIRRSPMWEVHPVLCQNVTVRGVRIETHGPNNDGCDPESCRDVLIEDCYFDTGDDCIALKSGRNADGRRLATPIENVVIRNCQMKDGHGGVVIGSEITGGARNVFAERCRMDSPNLERALRLKTNAMRGGVIDGVYMRDVEVGQVSDAVLRINFFYEEGERGPFKPTVRNVVVERVTCRQSRYGVYLRGFDDHPIRDVRLSDCTFEQVANGNFAANVEGLVLENVRMNGAPVAGVPPRTDVPLDRN